MMQVLLNHLQKSFSFSENKVGWKPSFTPRLFPSLRAQLVSCGLLTELMVCCLVVREPLVPSLLRGSGMEWPSTGFEDFLIMIGWAASSSTFLSGGSIEAWSLSAGAAERVGFFSNSKSISTYRISLLMGACVWFGLLTISATTFFAPFSLIKLSSFATIRSNASSKSSIFILSFLSIFIISLSKAMNSLLKLYCEMIAQNLSSSLPCLALDSPCSCSMASSGNSLHIQQMQFILVLAVRSGFPRMSQLMMRPTANTIDLSSKSLLVSTLSGEEYLRSCNQTRSSFERSRFAKASMWAILTLRQLLETKRADGLSYRGTSVLSCRCMTI